MITPQKIYRKIPAYKKQMGLQLSADRELCGLSLERVSELTDITIQTIEDIEQGKYNGLWNDIIILRLVYDLYFKEAYKESKKMFVNLNKLHHSILEASLKRLSSLET